MSDSHVSPSPRIGNLALLLREDLSTAPFRLPYLVILWLTSTTAVAVSIVVSAQTTQSTSLYRAHLPPLPRRSFRQTKSPLQSAGDRSLTAILLRCAHQVHDSSFLAVESSILYGSSNCLEFSMHLKKNIEKGE